MTTTEKEAFKVAKREQQAIRQAEELERQAALFREINSRAAERNRPTPYPDVDTAIMTMMAVKNPDGSFVVRMRENPLETIDWDMDGHRASITSSKSYSERWHMTPTQKPPRQKYGDAARLEGGGDHVNDALSIDVKDVEAVGSVCM